MAGSGADSHPTDPELDAWFEKSLTEPQQERARRRTRQSDYETAALALNGALMWTPSDRMLLQTGRLPRRVQTCIVRHDIRSFVVTWTVFVVAEMREFALRAVDNMRRLGTGSG